MSIVTYGAMVHKALEAAEDLSHEGLSAEVVEGQLRFPLVVRLPERLRREPGAIARVMVSAPSGEQVPLDRLADVGRTFAGLIRGVVDRPG